MASPEMSKAKGVGSFYLVKAVIERLLSDIFIGLGG